MNLFEYLRPETLAQAIAAGSQPGAAYLAAGTNLVDLMKLGAVQPGQLVDISRLPGLDHITFAQDGSARIGALVRNADLARHPEFARRFPMVAEALLSGASAQLRNMATLGGNIMQHTRCAYFHDTASACNRRNPGSGCDAIGGENRGHAILGFSDACIATHPSDLCVPLVALDAVAEIAGPMGNREIALADLHLLPGTDAAPETALEPGEIITALRLPPGAAGFQGHARYVKLRERTSFAFALVSAAAALQLQDGRITAARLALGAVAVRPWRAHAAEQALIGQTPGREAFQRAAEIALRDARPSGNNAHKIELARRVATRALLLAANGTPARLPALPGSAFAPQNE